MDCHLHIFFYIQVNIPVHHDTKNFKEGDLQDIIACMKTKEKKEMRINYSPSFDPMDKIVELYEKK